MTIDDIYLDFFQISYIKLKLDIPLILIANDDIVFSKLQTINVNPVLAGVRRCKVSLKI
jgi:hypothetical protein